MSQYAKMKNDELQAMLRERGLPTTGKKAEMVDRLTKDDEKKISEPAPSNAHPEDEIDWDDGDEAAKQEEKPDKKTTSEEVAVTTLTQAETVAKAGGTGQPPNPQAVPNQQADIDPSKTDDLSVKPAGEATEAATGATQEENKEPAPSYAAGIAATDLDAEIEKRKKRAAKFGLKVEDDETLKKLERAKKFGESGALKGLDEALPERKERERKRGREDNEDAGRNKRRGGGPRAGGNRGGNHDGDRRRDNRENRRDDKRNDSGSTWMSAADRERAEARKAKWTKPAAAS
ncbi:hypothetical protein DPSP01_001400 [Paraphaeosphaeria sporulosa]